MKSHVMPHKQLHSCESQNNYVASNWLIYLKLNTMWCDFWLCLPRWGISFPLSRFLFSQTEYARFENGRYVFRIHRSPLCEYMINFIHKLKHLPEKYMMNSVLENFTILQVNGHRKTKPVVRVSLKNQLVEAKANTAPKANIIVPWKIPLAHQ